MKLLIAMAILVILADQLAASVIRGLPHGEFTFSEYTFGLTPFLALLLFLPIFILARRISAPIIHVACGLWLGGALNNFGEWLLKSSVEDFIPIGPAWGIWMVTNVADIAMVLGAAMMAIYAIKSLAR